MLKFILLVNKQGQTRLAQYYEHPEQDRVSIERDIIRKCLAREDSQCSFLEYKNFKLVYRRYASLYFIVGVDHMENELAILELIHNIVETYDKYFDKVCELDIMFNLDKAYMILEEMVMNGRIVEMNQNRILLPIRVMDQAAQ
ncbi:PREDICTED: AP-4 complex subunit sigma-like [Branchiostoma belcheri]|uniref:AP complex subunit sigma n=1 Tax=Branchiostoma belcheri TaxID=7741 RepID=A0A6P4ZIV7_BRABE|nr:PREDICTED: AP-4 complex subunit sigma-like [Branchiostoma belcheri]XP_019631022.1 PREDICTED: AP-4 complex subunit sigma-like [Branchiostoma belcheri]